ncbi:MAG TPA: DUF2911 domain-containing protein [Cyclobacteriaceae bacterium]|nr:DUF2911 domain-containing protein [Cyclobacteriaceae bacterium]
MKRVIVSTIVIVALAVGGYFAYLSFFAKPLSPKEEVDFQYKDLNVHLVYSRPYRKNRLIFGKEEHTALVPFGKYWRLGANEATEITFSKPIVFVGTLVPAGTYRMYAVPGEYVWEVSLNSELGQSGSTEPNYALDVAKVQLPVQTFKGDAEQFTIQFGGNDVNAKIQLIWDITMVEIPFAPRRE